MTKDAENQITLRDYFAAAIMSGMYASMASEGDQWPTPDKAPAQAYEMADAMLLQRTKG